MEVLLRISLFSYPQNEVSDILLMEEYADLQFSELPSKSCRILSEEIICTHFDDFFERAW